MDIINFLQGFSGDNGVKSAIILVLTLVITNLIKPPIKRHGAKIAALAQKSGFSITEGFINSMINYIPFGVAFVLFCIVDGVCALAGGGFDIVGILVKTPLVAAGSIGFYSVIEGMVQKASQKKEYNEYLKSMEDETEEDKQAENKTDKT